ncbi:hypothetical protein GTQ99_24080, partial [Kineococcus sp. T13]|uniref:hypothetical protein n=1 Tax=Kineococcus vitellinus TaxID=2696565 RepID=UPI0014120F6C
VAVFGDQVAIADTLDAALDDVFGGDSGASAGDEGAAPVPGSPSADPGAQVQLDQALQQARQAITDSQAALQRGDFTAYGE